jgi:Tfp pilus assembly protein PilZ
VYERSALILDAPDHRLGQLSLSLILLGHRPLYASDLDELVLLAREYRSQAGAVLLPAACAPAWWPSVLKRIVEPLGLTPAGVLPVGPRLAEADVEALRRDGVCWTLEEPFSPWELRFAVSMVLSAADPNEVRLKVRVPCSIAVDVDSSRRSTPARLTDLSTGGAFVQLARPHAPGTAVVLRGNLSGRLVSLPARVAWSTGADSPAWCDPGMGVEFERVGQKTLALLHQQVEAALRRFRLGAAGSGDREDGSAWLSPPAADRGSGGSAR